MFVTMVHPHSTISAKAILQATIRHYKLDNEQPTLIRAIELSDSLMRKHGLYVKPDYLLTVWQETVDKHDTLNPGRR